jgi:hypothetical protein
MNCGPATVTAAKKKRYAPAPKTPTKRDTTFPEMFVANLAGVSNNCATTEGIDIEYPDPGQSLEQGAGANLGAPVNCGATLPEVSDTGATAPPPAGNSTSSGGSSATGSSPAAASTAAASGAGSPGVFASGAAATSSAAPLATSTAIVSPLPDATASGSAPPAAGTGTTTATGTQSGPCTPEGAWACSADGSSFQRCASGVWSVPMAMAAGTQCTPGTSMTLNETVDKAKRGAHNQRARRSYRA